MVGTNNPVGTSNPVYTACTIGRAAVVHHRQVKVIPRQLVPEGSITLIALVCAPVYMHPTKQALETKEAKFWANAV